MDYSIVVEDQGAQVPWNDSNPVPIPYVVLPWNPNQVCSLDHVISDICDVVPHLSPSMHSPLAIILDEITALRFLYLTPSLGGEFW